MADDNAPEEFVDIDEDAVEYEATLVHGETYYLGNKKFEKGVAQPVTNAEKALLEDPEHASDVLTMTAGGSRSSVTRDKFKFAPVGTAKKGGGAAAASSSSEPAAPPRRRSVARG